jgi:hypothetical protein
VTVDENYPITGSLSVGEYASTPELISVGGLLFVDG